MPPVRMLTPAGRVVTIDESEVEAARQAGLTVESAAERTARLDEAVIEERNSGLADQILAGAAGLARGFTAGGSDAVIRGLGTAGTVRKFRELRDVNPEISAATEIAAGVAPALLTGGTGAAATLARATPAGAFARAGARLARTGEGAGALAKIGAAARGGAAEGSLFGAGQGVTELALSEDPVTVERAASVLSSKMLYGAAIGAGAGTVAKAAEVGLARTNAALKNVAAKAEARAGVADDLASLDMKGLRAAEQTEVAAIKADRVTQKARLADEITAFRRETLEQKPWLATEGAEEVAIKKLGRRTFDADREIDRLLSNPKRMAQRPEAALAALQKQDAAIEEILTHADKLRATFRADGARMAALDSLPGVLKRNQALQARIADLTGDIASPRLTAIQDAKDALTTGSAKRGIPEQLASGATFSTVTGAVASLPIPGAALIAPAIGAGAARMVSERVFGRLGHAAAETSERTARAISAFLDVTKRVTPAAPVLATKVLSGVRFAPEKAGRPAEDPTKPEAPTRARLADLYRERAAELASQVMPTPAGPRMRMPARQAMAARLDPIRTANPLIADQIETVAARRLEFLARMLPKRPRLDDTLEIGPDTWIPSDMEMRTFARYVAAVEDPGGVEERLAAGTVTPEDREAMEAVYPERYAEIRRMIAEQLPTLRAKLPYQKRLALSIFTRLPVDASMTPSMLRVFQAQRHNEPETDGGTHPPMPEAQFGSVRKLAENELTPSQARMR